MIRERPIRTVFLTVSGPQIGFGHLRRCLTLAEELLSRGSVEFLLAGDRAAGEIVTAAGMKVSLVGQEWDGVRDHLRRHPADLLVIDDYAVLDPHIASLRPLVGAVAVIDDLGDRQLDVDAVVNTGAGAHSLRYPRHANCIYLLGPSYALLNRQFRGLPIRKQPDQPHSLLITLGGGDPHGWAPRVARVAVKALPNAQIDLVIGPLFQINDLGPSPNVRLHRDLRSLAPLMAACDMAVSGGGQTTYELAAAGVPTIALCVADNQRLNLSALAAIPTLVESSCEEVVLETNLVRLASDRALRARMSAAGKNLVDGAGAVRVADALVRLARAKEASHG